MEYRSYRGQEPCHSHNSPTINVNRMQHPTINVNRMVCDVIQRLFPVSGTLYPGREGYLCYGEGPWSFRFRFKENGIQELTTLDPRGLRTVVSTVIYESGLERLPRLRRTKYSLSRQGQALCTFLLATHPRNYQRSGLWGASARRGLEAALPLPSLSFTAGSQTGDSSSLGL